MRPLRPFFSYLLISLISAFVFFSDSLIKNFLRDRFLFKSFPIIRNILHITVIPNTGAAFGILKGKTDLLIYIGLIFILIFLRIIFKEKEKKLFFLISSGLVLGGVFSNMYDRIFFGYVLDYIDLRIWPVFNISDFSICTGAIILVLSSFIKQKK